jgi:hypothetical protein
MNRKTGTYYVEGLSTKSFKRIASRNFENLKDAIREAQSRQKRGKIHQADILFSENIIKDIQVAGLDTKGKITHIIPCSICGKRVQDWAMAHHMSKEHLK